MNRTEYSITVGTADQMTHGRLGRYTSDDGAIRAAMRDCRKHGASWWRVEQDGVKRAAGAAIAKQVPNA